MPGDIFLVLAGLGDLATALSGPAALFQMGALHELCLGHEPPSTLFAAAFTLESATAAAVAPTLVAALGRLSHRQAVVVGLLAEALYFVGLAVAGHVMQPGWSFWPVVMLQALKGCTQSMFRTALQLLKYQYAAQMSEEAVATEAAGPARDGGKDAAATAGSSLTVQQAAAKLTSNRMAVEAAVALLAAAVYRVGQLSAELALVAALLINAAQVCAALVFIGMDAAAPPKSEFPPGPGTGGEKPAEAETVAQEPGPSRTEPEAPAVLSSWGAFVAIWRVPLERVQLLGGLACIGAATRGR
jgi:hypothetical protein